MKNKKILVFFFLMIAFISMYFIYTNVTYIKEITYSIKQELYGEPINLQTGQINNQFFNINNEGKNAKSTTSGINEAIEYANLHNIECIRLEPGTYTISGEVGNLQQKNEKKESY